MPNSGIADFFATVAGRNGIRANARDSEADRLIGIDTSVARRDKALADAAIAADQRLQREKVAAAARAAYGAGNENLADFTSTSSLAGLGNISQGANASETVSDTLMKIAAQRAMAAGDPRTANSNLAAVSGRPVPVVKEAGGVMFNPYDPGVAPELTGPGAAMVAARTASAGSRTASADASRARADLTRRTDPNRQRGKGSAPPSAPASTTKAPYPDGTKLKKNGKVYVVRNGVPEPV